MVFYTWQILEGSNRDGCCQTPVVSESKVSSLPLYWPQPFEPTRLFERTLSAFPFPGKLRQEHHQTPDSWNVLDAGAVGWRIPSIFVGFTRAMSGVAEFQGQVPWMERFEEFGVFDYWSYVVLRSMRFGVPVVSSQISWLQLVLI